MLVMAPIMCIGGIVMALREDLALSRLLLVCIPVLAGSIGFIIGRMIPKFRAMQPKIDTVNRVLREQITGMRVVRAFVREPVEAERFDGANAELTGDRAAHRQAAGADVADRDARVQRVERRGAVVRRAPRSRDGTLEIGALTAYLSYLMQILVAVMMTTFMSIMIPRAAVCAERIVEVLDMEPAVAPPRVAGRCRPRAPASSSCAASSTATRARAAPVLADISFTARPGEVTAIIGSTGAGKTTLLELIPRLADPTAGTVLVDGVDVRERDPEELWARIGMVPQRAYLFSGTVATNLRFGNPTRPTTQLWAALEVAQAKDFVEADAAEARVADRAGRHERVGRPAPAPRDRARAAARARRCSCSTIRSRRSTSRPRRGCARRSRRASRTRP